MIVARNGAQRSKQKLKDALLTLTDDGEAHKVSEIGK
jgi:hypothetical protein